MALLIDIGGVLDTHAMRRRVEGKPIALAGRWWTIGEVRDRDGKRLIELAAMPAVDREGKPRPLICLDCGGLRLRPQGMVTSCADCGSFEVAP